MRVIPFIAVIQGHANIYIAKLSSIYLELWTEFTTAGKINPCRFSVDCNYEEICTLSKKIDNVMEVTKIVGRKGTLDQRFL